MRQKGFTLIELLVVISIIGLLSTIAVAALQQARAKARDVKRLADQDAIVQAIELYLDDNGIYPFPADGIGAFPPFRDGYVWSTHDDDRWGGDCGANPESLQCMLKDYIHLPEDPLNEPGHEYRVYSKEYGYFVIVILENDHSLMCKHQMNQYKSLGGLTWCFDGASIPEVDIDVPEGVVHHAGDNLEVPTSFPIIPPVLP